MMMVVVVVVVVVAAVVVVVVVNSMPTFDWNNNSFHLKVPCFEPPSDGLFVEDIQDLVLQNVTVIFHKQRQQPYWTMVCFNTSAARWPVQMSGCACSN
jgi:hypothetical protein